jgi:hypothetical protein
MHLRTFVAAAASLAALLVHERADAQAYFYPQITYDAVTSYSAQPVSGSAYGFIVTGVQHGASAPSTFAFVANYSASGSEPQSAVQQSCERALLVATNRPGRFSFSVSVQALPAAGSTGPVQALGCALTQLP